MKNLILIVFVAAAFLTTKAEAQISIGVKAPKLGSIKKKEEKKDENKDENKEDKKENKTEPAAPKKKYTAEEEAKILEIGKSDKYKQDCETIKKMDNMYNPGTNFGEVAYTIRDAVEQMSKFSASRDEFNRISKDYEDYWSVYKEQEGRDASIYYDYKRVRRGLEEFENRVKTGYTEVPAKITNYLNSAKEKADKLLAEKTLKDSWGNDIFDGKINADHDQAYFFLNILKFQKGEADAEYQSLNTRYKTEADEIQKKKKELEASMELEKVSSVKCPAEVYKGADKESLKKGLRDHWKKNYPEDKILGIYIIDSNWDRQSGKEWDKAGNKWREYDSSWLKVQVVVQNKEDSNLANILGASIQKNHKKNNEIDYAYFNKQLGIGKGKMLAKNVK